jgi:hypothetical protein
MTDEQLKQRELYKLQGIQLYFKTCKNYLESIMKLNKETPLQVEYNSDGHIEEVDIEDALNCAIQLINQETFQRSYTINKLRYNV